MLASAGLALAFHCARDVLCGGSESRARFLLGRWCRHAWSWLSLSVAVEGAQASLPCVYIANHRSYLDILVLAGVLEASFLSRSDVSAWPIVGRAARDTGVVFVDRSDAKARALAARALTRRIGMESLVVFPEGTTMGERLAGDFEGGLFRMLHRARVPVVPVTLRYSRRDAYWLDETGVGEHLLRSVLPGGPLRVEVHLGAAIDPAHHAHAAGLRSAVHAAVCAPIETHGEFVSG